MKSKKSQMNLEVIMVLFIFLILVGIGFAVKGKLDTASVRDSISEQERQSSVTIAQKISFLPELVCTSNAIIENNCFDLLKIKAMSNITHYVPDENEGGSTQLQSARTEEEQKSGEQTIVDDYFETFGYGNITFQIIYPEEYGELNVEEYQNITVYEYAKKEDGKYYYDTAYKTHVPVTIFNPITNDYYLGKLIIQTYGY